MNLIPEVLLERIFTAAEKAGVKSARKLMKLTRMLIAEYRQNGMTSEEAMVIFFQLR